MRILFGMGASHDDRTRSRKGPLGELVVYFLCLGVLGRSRKMSAHDPERTWTMEVVGGLNLRLEICASHRSPSRKNIERR